MTSETPVISAPGREKLRPGGTLPDATVVVSCLVYNPWGGLALTPAPAARLAELLPSSIPVQGGGTLGRETIFSRMGRVDPRVTEERADRQIGIITNYLRFKIGYLELSGGRLMPQDLSLAEYAVALLEKESPSQITAESIAFYKAVDESFLDPARRRIDAGLDYHLLRSFGVDDGKVFGGILLTLVNKTQTSARIPDDLLSLVHLLPDEMPVEGGGVLRKSQVIARFGRIPALKADSTPAKIILEYLQNRLPQIASQGSKPEEFETELAKFLTRNYREVFKQLPSNSQLSADYSSVLSRFYHTTSLRDVTSQLAVRAVKLRQQIKRPALPGVVQPVSPQVAPRQALISMEAAPAQKKSTPEWELTSRQEPDDLPADKTCLVKYSAARRSPVSFMVNTISRQDGLKVGIFDPRIGKVELIQDPSYTMMEDGVEVALICLATDENGQTSYLPFTTENKFLPRVQITRRVAENQGVTTSVQLIRPRASVAEIEVLDDRDPRLKCLSFPIGYVEGTRNHPEERRAVFSKDETIALTSLRDPPRTFYIGVHPSGLTYQLEVTNDLGDKIPVAQVSPEVYKPYQPIRKNPVLDSLKTRFGLGKWDKVFQIAIARDGTSVTAKNVTVTSLDEELQAVYVVDRFFSGKREVIIVDRSRPADGNSFSAGIGIAVATRREELQIFSLHEQGKEARKGLAVSDEVARRRQGSPEVFNFELKTRDDHYRYSLVWRHGETPKVLDNQALEHNLTGLDKDLVQRLAKTYLPIGQLNLPENCRRFGFSLNRDQSGNLQYAPVNLNRYQTHLSTPSILVFEYEDARRHVTVNRCFVIDPTNEQNCYEAIPLRAEEKIFADYPILARGTRENPAIQTYASDSGQEHILLASMPGDGRERRLLITLGEKGALKTVDLSTRRESIIRPIGKSFWRSALRDRLAAALNPLLASQQIKAIDLLNPGNDLYIINIKRHGRKIFETHYSTHDLQNWPEDKNTVGQAILVFNKRTEQLLMCVLDRSIDPSLPCDAVNTGTGIRIPISGEVLLANQIRGEQKERTANKRQKLKLQLTPLTLGVTGLAGIAGGYLAMHQLSPRPVEAITVPAPPPYSATLPVVRFVPGEGLVSSFIDESPDLPNLQDGEVIGQRNVYGVHGRDPEKGKPFAQTLINAGSADITLDPSHAYIPQNVQYLDSTHFIMPGIGEKRIIYDEKGNRIELLATPNQIPVVLQKNGEGIIVKFLTIANSDGTGFSYPDLGKNSDGTPVYAVDEGGYLILDQDPNQPVFRIPFHDDMPQLLIRADGQVVGFALDQEKYQDIFLVKDPENNVFYAKDVAERVKFDEKVKLLNENKLLTPDTTFNLVNPDFKEARAFTVSEGNLVYKDISGEISYPDFGKDRKGEPLLAKSTPYVWGTINSKNIFAIPAHDSLPDVFVLEDGTFLGAGKLAPGQITDPNTALFRSNFQTPINVKDISDPDILQQKLMEVGRVEVMLSDYRYEPFEMITTDGKLFARKDYKMTRLLADTDVLTVKEGYVPHVYQYFETDYAGASQPTDRFFIVNPLTGKMEFISRGLVDLNGDGAWEQPQFVLRRILVYNPSIGDAGVRRNLENVWSRWTQDSANSGAIQIVDPDNPNTNSAILIPRGIKEVNGRILVQYYESPQKTDFTYQRQLLNGVAITEPLFVLTDQLTRSSFLTSETAISDLGEYRRGRDPKVHPDTIEYINTKGEAAAYAIYPGIDYEVIIDHGIAHSRPPNILVTIDATGKSVFEYLSEAGGKDRYQTVVFDSLPTLSHLQRADIILAGRSDQLAQFEAGLVDSPEFKTDGAVLSAFTSDGELIGVNDLVILRDDSLSDLPKLILSLKVLGDKGYSSESDIFLNSTHYDKYRNRVRDTVKLGEAIKEILEDGPNKEIYLKSLLEHAHLDYLASPEAKIEKWDLQSANQQLRKIGNLGDSEFILGDDGVLHFQTTAFDMTRLVQNVIQGKTLNQQMSDLVRSIIVRSGEVIDASYSTPNTHPKEWHYLLQGATDTYTLEVHQTNGKTLVVFGRKGSGSDGVVLEQEIKEIIGQLSGETAGVLPGKIENLSIAPKIIIGEYTFNLETLFSTTQLKKEFALHNLIDSLVLEDIADPEIFAQRLTDGLNGAGYTDVTNSPYYQEQLNHLKQEYNNYVRVDCIGYTGILRAIYGEWLPKVTGMTQNDAGKSRVGIASDLISKQFEGMSFRRGSDNPDKVSFFGTLEIRPTRITQINEGDFLITTDGHIAFAVKTIDSSDGRLVLIDQSNRDPNGPSRPTFDVLTEKNIEEKLNPWGKFFIMRSYSRPDSPKPDNSTQGSLRDRQKTDQRVSYILPPHITSRINPQTGWREYYDSLQQRFITPAELAEEIKWANSPTGTVFTPQLVVDEKDLKQAHDTQLAVMRNRNAGKQALASRRAQLNTAKRQARVNMPRARGGRI